jgi:hypothetical protein
MRYGFFNSLLVYCLIRFALQLCDCRDNRPRRPRPHPPLWWYVDAADSAGRNAVLVDERLSFPLAGDLSLAPGLPARHARSGDQTLSRQPETSGGIDYALIRPGKRA